MGERSGVKILSVDLIWTHYHPAIFPLPIPWAQDLLNRTTSRGVYQIDISADKEFNQDPEFNHTDPDQVELHGNVVSTLECQKQQQ